MRIEVINDIRKLIKDDQTTVNVSNGQIIMYTGIYYKIINDIDYLAKIETLFIGKIECDKCTPHDGLTGIYVDPLYIYDKLNSEWKKIKEYKFTNSLYFVYPHLLQLPHFYSTKYPLDFLHTCINRNLDEFLHITSEFTLDEII